MSARSLQELTPPFQIPPKLVALEKKKLSEVVPEEKERYEVASCFRQDEENLENGQQ